ncbi:MAG: zf-HC2 domain-containing protein [Planctomycetes bacterium]|nr:zf-HC2 domain-containing protein [Planctomycetota bacterium]
MTCRETREYLYAFLDSELDAALSIELQRHLEHCPPCAQQAELERAIRRQLGSALESQVAEASTEEAALRRTIDRVTTQRRSFGLLSRRGYLITSAAAAVAIAVGVLSIMRPWDASESERCFAGLLVADFEHFQQEGRPLQIASAERGVVSSWLHDKTALPVALPIAGSTDVRLLGGRKCTLEGQPAAFALYEVDGVPVSLVAVSRDVARLIPKNPATGTHKPHFVDHCRGHTVVASMRGPLVYAAVSTLPAEQLIGLMPETNAEVPGGGHGTKVETH